MTGRTVIVGRNSAVWRELAGDSRLHHCIAIGHAEIGGFTFTPADQIWILSYSRDMADNRRLFEQLAAAGARDCVYFSTATANVDAVTGCYAYPRVKRECERLSRTMLAARIVTIGVVFRAVEDLPAGMTMATSVDRLARFISAPTFLGNSPINLFAPIDRPFSSTVERMTFKTYGALQRLASRWPCLLRPIDSALRALGWRWYGYLYLSNRIWLTTTSS